jgi:hypothetical protein
MSFEPSLIIFGRGQIFKRLMWPDKIICSIPLFQLLIMFLHLQADILDLVKLLPVGPVRPLHIALQFWSARGDDEEPDPAFPASLLEVLFKLRSAIDLDGADWEGELLFHVLEELGGGVACGVPEGSRHVPAGDQIPGTELPTAVIALEPDLKGVNLDEVPGSRHPVSLRLTYGISGLAPTFTGFPRLTDIKGLHQKSPRLEPVQDSADCRGRDPVPFFTYQDDDLVLTPTRILQPFLKHQIFD